MKEKKLYYTDAEAKELIDCEVNYNHEWRNGKFLRRGRGTAVILLKHRPDTWIAVSQPIDTVKVNGQQLKYIGKHSFTNPKCPFVHNLYK